MNDEDIAAQHQAYVDGQAQAEAEGAAAQAEAEAQHNIIEMSEEQRKLEEKLAKLRVAYKDAKTNGEKKLIVARANYLKKLFTEKQNEKPATPEEAQEIFKA